MTESISDERHEEAQEVVDKFIDNHEGDVVEALNDLRTVVAERSPVKENPIDLVQWVDLDRVRPNDYNPNQVADREMELLHKSIYEDGYTQPVVVVELPEDDPEDFEIVDGFHRYMTMKMFDDVYERSDGMLPVTIIEDKSKNERRASTVRHNRARGTHSISGKSDVVFGMLEDGASDEEICEQLGMEKDELARLKHTTGFAKLFDDTDYQKAWKATRQLDVEKEFEDEWDGEVP
jgi:hypothetical protein